MDLLLETGPVKNQLWEVLLIHLLIKYLSVSYMLAWPMQILFQVRMPACVHFNNTGKNDTHQLGISLDRQIIFVPGIYFSTLNCFPNFKLLNCLACQAFCFTLEFISLLYFVVFLVWSFIVKIEQILFHMPIHISPIWSFPRYSLVIVNESSTILEDVYNFTLLLKHYCAISNRACSLYITRILFMIFCFVFCMCFPGCSFAISAVLVFCPY